MVSVLKIICESLLVFMFFVKFVVSYGFVYAGVQ